MRPDIFLHALGTSVPQQSIQQDKMLEMVSQALPDDHALQVLVGKLYQQSGIRKRHSVINNLKSPVGNKPFIPPYRRESDGPTTVFRNSLFVAHAGELAEAAVRDLLKKNPSFTPDIVTHLITASCTGFSAPGFDLELVHRLGLPLDTVRIHIGFMGCLAAFPALKTAKAICAEDPKAKALIVCCELCSIHYRHSFLMDTIIANCIFADGAAAGLVSSDPLDGNGHGMMLKGFNSRILPGSHDEMSWLIGNHGFEMKLSQSIPGLIGQNIRDILGQTSAKAGIPASSIKKWAVHPGGRAILDQIGKELNLDNRMLEASYSILRDFGNMSSAAVLFVLERLLSSGSTGPVFAISFGPGLTAESGILEVF